MGVENPLEMSDTEQGDIGLETQHELDISDEDTPDTQAVGGTQKGKGTGKGKANKRSKKRPVLFSAEQEQKLVTFLRDNKDMSKREAVWPKFCEENNLDKDACQKWFQSLRESHSHEVRPGGTTADREAEMDQRQCIQGSQGVCFSSQCSSGLIIQTGDCADGTVPGCFSSRVNL